MTRGDTIALSRFLFSSLAVGLCWLGGTVKSLLVWHVARSWARLHAKTKTAD